MRGAKTTSLSVFLTALKVWEVEAIKYRESTTAFNPAGPSSVTTYEFENHAKLRIFDHDFRGVQIVNEVGGAKMV